MAGENLKILITGTLNTGATIGEINTALKGIEKKINKLQLKVDIGSEALKAINTFSNNVKKLQLKMDVHANTKPAEDEIKQITKSSAKFIAKSMDEAKQQLRSVFGDDNVIGTQAFKSGKGALRSFIVDVKDAEGKLQRVNYEIREFVKKNKEGEIISKEKSFVSTWIQEMNMAEAELKKLSQLQEKLRTQLQAGLITGKLDQSTHDKLLNNVNKATTSDELKALQNKNAILKAQQQANNSLASSQEKLMQGFKKLYDAGKLSENRLRDFNKIINSAKNVQEIEKIEKALQRVSQTSNNKQLQQKLLSQARTLLAGNSKKLDVTGVNNLINSLKNIKPNVSSASNELNRLQAQLKEYQANARVAAAHTLTFGSALKQALSGFSLWSLTAQMVYAPINALKDMTQRLIEIDTLMTDIRRVMNMPDFKFTQLLEEAVGTSDELSSKLNDVLKIMGDFGRMGFGENQLVDITKTAQVLQNISDLDASSSVDTLTSAMLNFNIAAEDSITIADKLNEVDNNYAISTKDLSDGIRKAAASAKTFGVDINQLTGYIAAIGSTTRESGTIVGNGLKTIFSRITTMDDAIGALNSVGVSIKDMAGNVRPVSNILEDLAGKWTKLSDEQRQNLGVTLAGRFQLTR
jgi:DNA repair exonuclease SbcCD ATPase subunit